MKVFNKGRHYLAVLMILALSIVTFGAAAMAAPSKYQTQYQSILDRMEPTITLSTTTSTQDSGLLDVLIPAFEKKFQNKVKVKVVAVGTGAALQLGRDANADVLLVHSRPDEDKFVSDGYGIKACDVMYNQFLVVGPKSDPAKIASAQTVAEAFQKISDSKAKFISRGDNSGTHKKELRIWEKGNMKPEGSWYMSAGQGMGDTLRMAEEMGGYTLTDEATFLTNKTDLVVLFKGDQDLFNPYGTIQVKSTKKTVAANELVWFFISPQGQKLINDFGKEKYGKSIFVPSAKRR